MLQADANVISLLNVSAEIKNLCRRSRCSLERKDNASLQNIDWSELASELKEKAPTLWLFLLTVVGANKKTNSSHDCALSFLAACLLFYRNQRLSRAQYIIGLILDSSGATDEVGKADW